ncbi:hypothetical protein CG736_02320 [Kitasatospora sp. CB02891]|nr:hypothetical protein CG736_02320 [Kitasatospora sp. CB02891]
MVLATLCAAPGVLWVVLVGGSGIDFGLVLGALAAAAPLLARDVATFRTACLTMSCAVLGIAVLGFLFGLFVLLPAGLVLLTAASRARPEPRPGPLALGVLVSTVTLGLAGWLIGEAWVAPLFRGPDAYLATVQEGSPLLPTGHTHAISYDAQDLGHGATHVFLLETGGVPGAGLTVVFDPRTSAADRAELRRTIAELPGVTNVRLCRPAASNCR